LFETYHTQVEFFMVYIKEAHPEDGWQVRQNQQEGISVKDPRTFAERAKVAEKACSLLKIKLPCLVDGMNDAANKAYGAWPDRIYLVDREGRLAVVGDQGPAGFSPSVKSAQAWLEANAKAEKR
jgi:Iodothyronine deiodinase